MRYEDDALDSVTYMFFIYFGMMVTATFMSAVYQFHERARNMDLYSYRQYDFKYRR